MAEHWLPRLPRSHKGCLNCGPLWEWLPWGHYLATGFGQCMVTRDGEPVYTECSTALDDDSDPPRLRRFTRRAYREPARDWRVHILAPLYDAEYQWQGDKWTGKWFLVRRGEGFA
jgi:hypothetical protein